MRLIGRSIQAWHVNDMIHLHTQVVKFLDVICHVETIGSIS
jgi:hypothetical protein